MKNIIKSLHSGLYDAALKLISEGVIADFKFKENLVTCLVKDETTNYTVRLTISKPLRITCNCPSDNIYCIHSIITLISSFDQGLLSDITFDKITTNTRTNIKNQLSVNISKYRNNIELELIHDGNLLLVDKLKEIIPSLDNTHRELAHLFMAIIEREEGSLSDQPVRITGINNHTGSLLLEFLKTSKITLKGAQILFNPAKATLHLKNNNFFVKVHFNNTSKILGEEVHLFGSDTLWGLYEAEQLLIMLIDTSHPESTLSISKQLNIHLSVTYLQDFIKKSFFDMGKKGYAFTPINNILTTTKIHPKPKIYLEEDDGMLYIKPFLEYHNRDIPLEYDNDVYVLKDNTIIKITRDHDYETAIRNSFFKTCIRQVSKNVFTPANNPLDWMSTDLQLLLSKGFIVFGDDRLNNYSYENISPQLNIHTTINNDWLELRGSAFFDDETIPLTDLIHLLRRNKKFIKLKSGVNTKIPDDWIDAFAKIIFSADISDDGIKLPVMHSHNVDSLHSVADKAAFCDDFKGLAGKLKDFKGITKVNLPEGFRTKLYPYQQEGVNWLLFCRDHGFGALLADDMGLGKSCQIIALLHVHYHLNNTNPSLLVVPTSLVNNWINEINKFAPHLSVYVHHSSRRKKSSAEFLKTKADIVITTYNTLVNDEKILYSISYDYGIIDEAQYQKNPSSKVSRCLSRMPANHKVAITGTPIENSALDLWSHFNFINPGLLGSQKYFSEYYLKELTGDSKLVSEKLRKTIKPFVLRRKKEQVISDLPEKLIFTKYFDMDYEQQKLYDITKNSYKSSVLSSIRDNNAANSRTTVFEALLRLRQIANHPRLAFNNVHCSSGKFTALYEQLRCVVIEGHKALVFSSFLKTLHMLKELLESSGIRTLYLDGSVKDRMSLVDEFQNSFEKKVFLISLKAGGVGLTLTAADHVFIVDPWWNPAAELQAMDRVHRIGQKKRVFVYKMITKNSVEEKILLLQERKNMLKDNILLQETDFTKHLTYDDISFIFD